VTAPSVPRTATAPAVTLAEANIATFRRAIEEGWSRGDAAVINELFAPDFIEHQAGIKPGRAGVIGASQALHAGFPDLRLTVEDVTATGDTVWARLRGTGTHEGPFQGAPATGRRIEITVIDVARIVDGRLVEHWGVADRLGLLQQIGLAPVGPR
jgi:predicted ester cyclase